MIKKFLIVVAIVVFLPLIYQLVWIGMLVNLIEKPLNDNEEVVPNIGIIDE